MTTPTVTVPREPTEVMVSAAEECGPIGCCNLEAGQARDIWSAMLAAAPAQPEADDTYEIWHDDCLVATSTHEADARHYAAVYGQDGPVRLVRAVTYRTEIDHG